MWESGWQLTLAESYVWFGIFIYNDLRAYINKITIDKMQERWTCWLENLKLSSKLILHVYFFLTPSLGSKLERPCSLSREISFPLLLMSCGGIHTLRGENWHYRPLFLFFTFLLFLMGNFLDVRYKIIFKWVMVVVHKRGYALQLWIIFAKVWKT